MEQTEKRALSPVAQRLLEFVEREGGFSTVAKRINKHPQFLYNIRDGKAKPSYDTLLDLHQAYRNKFDLMYVMTGQLQQEGVVTVYANPDQDSKLLAMENANLKRHVELLEDTVNILRNVVGSQLGKDLESKSKSTNESTQGEQMELDLLHGERKVRRFISLSVRDARGFSQTWPNLAPIYYPRR